MVIFRNHHCCFSVDTYYLPHINWFFFLTIAGNIHTSRGFSGYVQPSCDAPWSHLRFLGPTVMSAISLTVLWSSACVLHLVLLWNSIKALSTSEELTILAVVLISLSLMTLLAAALLLRIDCIYDPDWPGVCPDQTPGISVIGVGTSVSTDRLGRVAWVA